MAPDPPGGKPPSTEEQLIAALAEMNKTLRAIRRDIADLTEIARTLKERQDSHTQMMTNLSNLRRP